MPWQINFEAEPGRPSRNGVGRIPKIYQGAPYDYWIRVKQGDGTYRNFTGFDEIRMQARRDAASPVLFTLSKSGGQLVAGLDASGVQALHLTFAANFTDGLDVQNDTGAIVPEMLFVHDIELMLGGVVLERFAQGTGYIVANITRV